MASDPAKYDSALLAILQNEGKVAPFLDVVLGFLYRRTDFFRIMKLETDRLGFPPGVAYKLLKNIFKKYETLAERDSQRIDEMRKAKEKEGEPKEKQQREPTQQSDVEKSTSSAEAASNSADSVAVADTSEEPTLDGRGLEQPAVRTSESAAVENERDVRMETDNIESSGNADDNTSKESAAGEDEEKEDPEQERKRRELQANPLTYNGAEMEAYYWSQTITETDVRVKVPKSIIKGKQLKVDIRKNHISVSKQEADGSWTELVNKELSWEINTEESMWTLSPGEFVHINLEKKQERWWENVFVDEPKINTRKIDCSRPMTDLDDEAQAKIEEMMFNQRQKQLGLPQSHEQKTHDMLRKAWDAEGSPFKGQPFDPSRFTVDPSGVVNFGDSSS